MNLVRKIWYFLVTQRSERVDSKEWLRHDSSTHYQHQTESNENKENNYQEDSWLIPYQILPTIIMRIVRQTVKRITNEILGVKELNDRHDKMKCESWLHTFLKAMRQTTNWVWNATALLVPSSHTIFIHYGLIIHSSLKKRRN